MIYKFIVFFFFGYFFHFYSFGQTDLDSLKHAIDLLENDSVKIKTLIQLSRQIHRENANDEDDFLYAQRAADLAESYGDILLWAESLDNLGLLHRYHSRYAQAIPLHQHALDLINEKKVAPYYKMRFANNLAVAAR
ncbi:hypothetical protein [Lunatibacter salilacus]|uniref:hypothetical protein n=1 Tax=Lunatibacter salilacus TaxID=2483804 RepID=UPI00131D464C|nr:hypothetical protein [Lunatibacter salilacus]